MVSFLGSMISYVAIPYQVYELTKSNWMVGLLGAVQLAPILFFGLIGGSVADSMDRKKVLIVSEIFMAICVLGLALNSLLETPNILMIYVVTALMQSANGFHRPAMDAMTQKLVEPHEYAAISALGSFRSSFGHIAGPAIGGLLIATFGAAYAYFIDFLTFAIAIVAVSLINRLPPLDAKNSLSLTHIMEGVRYAFNRPELIGTYVIDIAAMTFAFPTALFPAMAQEWGGATAAGLLYSAMSVGSLVITVFSGWTANIRRHGAAVVIAALLWGAAIVALGFAPNFHLALICLALAGGADMVSGIFRGAIWNETIPNHMRGRLSGIEMISYMSGPLIGNARAGWVASATTVSFSIWTGGLICMLAVLISAALLPAFWRYQSAARGPALAH